MPKRSTHTLAEIHVMIVSDTKIRLGCAAFVPDFTLHPTAVDATHIRAPIGTSRKRAARPNIARATESGVGVFAQSICMPPLMTGP
jgi:hypothetical protein